MFDKYLALMCSIVFSVFSQAAHGQWQSGEGDTFTGNNYGVTDMYPLVFRDFTSTFSPTPVDEIISYGVLLRRGQDSLTLPAFLDEARVLTDRQLMAAHIAAADSAQE